MAVAATTWSDLVGRDDELRELERVVAAVRDGLSGAVVLRGDAGVGKTAMLWATANMAPDLRHLHVDGVEAESGFAFAGLERLVRAHDRDHLDLPPPQRAALDVAFGRSSGSPADPFMVGLATLSLLARLASEHRLLVTVDDAHWLDRESLAVLGFVARRLDAEGVGMVFASREAGYDLTPFDGLAACEVPDLEPQHARELLARIVEAPVDLRVADRVVSATSGNPLALCDIGALLSAGQFDGSEQLPEPLPVGARLERHYLALVAELAPSTQTWLLLAAAEPSGDAVAIAAAGTELGLSLDDAAPAELARVVTLGPCITFRHPLVRAAIYGAASGEDQRRVHAALAAVIAAEVDPDRHVRHLAEAARGPDEAVARELELAAARAELRGGYSARAELLSRSVTLTPDRAVAAVRALDAAEAAFLAGTFRRAESVLDSVDFALLDVRRRARHHLLDAQLHATSGEPGGSARIAARSLRAAELARDVDPDLAQEALARAWIGVMYADHFLEGTTLEEVSLATRATPTGSRTVSADLSAAFAALVLDGYAAAVPLIRALHRRMLDPTTPDDQVLLLHLGAVTLGTVVCDFHTTIALHERALRIARDTGAIGDLGTLLYTASMTWTILGHLAYADDLLAEGAQLHSVLARSTSEFDIYRHAELAAWRGGERAEIEEMFRITRAAGTAMGHGAVVVVVDVATVIFELSQGNYEAAAAVGRVLLEQEGFAMHTRVLPDLVEAASRAGDPVTANRALALLRERAAASEVPLALGLLARSEAIVADDDAERHHRDAIQRFADIDARADLARAHLVYGEWLRRQRRRVDASEQLRSAHAAFEGMGATGFAERARRELAATGERARARTVDTTRDLTAQERQIAMLAAEGLTNDEIASRLFISAPTVGYHLRKVFQKLDITSRRHLRGRTF